MDSNRVRPAEAFRCLQATIDRPETEKNAGIKRRRATDNADNMDHADEGGDSRGVVALLSPNRHRRSARLGQSKIPDSFIPPRRCFASAEPASACEH
jgi:hypothetical protein